MCVLACLHARVGFQGGGASVDSHMLAPTEYAVAHPCTPHTPPNMWTHMAMPPRFAPSTGAVTMREAKALELALSGTTRLATLSLKRAGLGDDTGAAVCVGLLGLTGLTNLEYGASCVPGTL